MDFQSESRHRPGAVSSGADPLAPTGWGPAPAAPPVRLRTGAPFSGPGAPGHFGDAPPPPPPAPDRFPPVSPGAKTAPTTGRPSRGWGWRALAAFVAGGLIAATGFGVAELDEDETVAAPAVQIARPGAETPTPPPSSATPGAEPVAEVARALGPAVVQIETNIGLGSGVIYSSDGYILTNNHVVTGSTSVQVRLADGSRLPGEVLGSDPVVDIAVVKVDPPQDMPVAQLALNVPIEVGQLAVAIGSPFELQQTVTSGIVSAVNRPVPNANGIVAMIQTDAPINPGNSGGALANRRGQVIGINTSIRTETGTNAGIGFAVPIDTAMETAQRIINGESLDQAFLGVAGGEPPAGESGVLVTEITPGSAAEVAGVQVGDRITAIDGQPVADLLGLAALVRSQRPGEQVVIDVIRNGAEVEVPVELGTQTRPGG